MERIGGHAVVIGASMAGLLAARVLSERFDRVTVVERDHLPALGQGRRGVPQGRHIHALLPSGQQVLDRLFPGFTGALIGAGVPSAVAFTEIRFSVAGHRLAPVAVRSDQPALSVSRPFLEGSVRERLLAIPNVTVLQGCDALGLVAAGDRVTGVRVLRRAPGSAEESLPAELVVDASGRSGRTPVWLEALGYPRPPEQRLEVDLVYVTRHLHLNPGALGERIVLIGPKPGHPRGMGLLAVEGGGWMCTLFGYGRHHPPTEPDAWLAFLDTVAPEDVRSAVHEGEPLEEVATHRFPANLRRRYDRVARFPEGLLVLGDAIASFNPIYAQGMSVAALEALELQRCLEQGIQGIARRFFRAATRIVDQAWDLAVGGDLALPEVAGRRTVPVRLRNAYMRRLLAAAERDPVVVEHLAPVIALLEPPTEILRPAVIRRVLVGAGRRGGGERAPRPRAGATPDARAGRSRAEG